MRTLLTATLAATVVIVTPAQAHPPTPKPDHHASRHCTPKKIGFNASGTLVSQALTQTAGAQTAARSDDRYSGTVTVAVVRANHRAPTGAQTYTLDNDRVHYSDANHDGTADAPKAGDRVKVHGKLTRLGKRCDATGFTATVDVRRIAFKPAKVEG